MSSLVQPKWMNSLIADSSSEPSTFDFKKYSTAFTSWLVVASISLTSAASCSLNVSTNSSKNPAACALSAWTSGIWVFSDSALSHATST